MLPFNCKENKDSNPRSLDAIFPDGPGRRQMKPVSASTPGTIPAIKWGSGLCTFYNKYANAAELLRPASWLVNSGILGEHLKL